VRHSIAEELPHKIQKYTAENKLVVKTMITNQACFAKPEISTPAKVPKDFRRLNCKELVKRGDYVKTERQGFEPWEGPGGFRADTFEKPIYRQQARPQIRLKKSKLAIS
jgi:hypothetical protein